MRKPIQVLLVARQEVDTEADLYRHTQRVAPRIDLISPNEDVLKVNVIGVGVTDRGVEALVLPVRPLWKVPALLLIPCGLIAIGCFFLGTPSVWGFFLSWFLGPITILAAKGLESRLEIRLYRREFQTAQADVEMEEALAEGKIIPFPGFVPRERVVSRSPKR